MKKERQVEVMRRGGRGCLDDGRMAKPSVCWEYVGERKRRVALCDGPKLRPYSTALRGRDGRGRAMRLPPRRRLPPPSF